jgi:hypothetical protein
MAMKVEIEISWFVTPCSSVSGNQYFEGACYLHLRPTPNPLYLTIFASILKMEVANPSEKLVPTYKRTHCHKPGRLHGTALQSCPTMNCDIVKPWDFSIRIYGYLLQHYHQYRILLFEMLD